MREAIKDCAERIIEKLNLFKLLQIVWLAEFHLLAFLAGKQILDNVVDEAVKEPLLITEHTKAIIDWLSEHEAYILYFAIVIFIVGLSGWCLVQMPFFKKYKLIYEYTDFGIYAGSWMFFIWLTYETFALFDTGFLLVPVVALVIYVTTKQLRKKIEGHMEEY